MRDNELMSIMATMSVDAGLSPVHLLIDSEVIRDSGHLSADSGQTLSDVFEELQFELEAMEAGYFEASGALKWGVR